MSHIKVKIQSDEIKTLNDKILNRKAKFDKQNEDIHDMNVKLLIAEEEILNQKTVIEQANNFEKLSEINKQVLVEKNALLEDEVEMLLHQIKCDQNEYEKMSEHQNQLVALLEDDLGAKYLGFFSCRSLKTREKYINFAQLILLGFFLREVCLFFNF